MVENSGLFRPFLNQVPSLKLCAGVCACGMSVGTNVQPMAATFSDVLLAANHVLQMGSSKHGIPQYKCTLCDTKATGQASLEHHLLGKHHSRAMSAEAMKKDCSPRFSPAASTETRRVQVRAKADAPPELPPTPEPVGHKRGRGNETCMVCFTAGHSATDCERVAAHQKK